MSEAPSLDLFRRVITNPRDPGVPLEADLRNAMEFDESLIPPHLGKAVGMGAPVELTGTRSVVGQTAFLYTVQLHPVFFGADFDVVFVRNDRAEISYLAANCIVAGMQDRPYYADASWSLLQPVCAMLRAKGLAIEKCSATYDRSKSVRFPVGLSAWNSFADKESLVRVFDRLVADYHGITYQGARPAHFAIVADARLTVVADDVTLLHAVTFP